MSLTIKPVYRNRRFVSAPYLYDSSTQRWLVAAAVDICAKSHTDPKLSCHIIKGRQRIRAVGPSHPLCVFKCYPHHCWFTVYPPGWLPFGRRILLDLDSKGEAVIGLDCWDNTAFGGSIDQEQGKVWPNTYVELLALNMNGIFCYGTRKTQLRHIQGAASVFGFLSPVEHQETVRLRLGIDQRNYQEACIRIRHGPSNASLGAACTDILKNLNQPSTVLFESTVHLGQELGFWGVCAHH